MADLQEAMKEHYLLISRDIEKDEEDDAALITLKGNFYNCGTHCHMAKDFRKIKKKMKCNGSCEGCGKSGHKHKDCLLDEANASKRLQNCRSGERVLETTVLNVDDSPEIVLAIADNENSILVKDAEDDIYEADLDSEWK